MLINFSKYHALQNDFLVIERPRSGLSKPRVSRLARLICDRRSGVGADGILYLSESKKADRKVDVLNTDGSRAEKSGNGLRIVGVHESLRGKRRKTFIFETAMELDRVKVTKPDRRCYMVKTELGKPEFETSGVPLRTRRRYMINAPLALGGMKFPVTCLAIGNPHTVLFVDDFDFDWRELGARIEAHHAFLNRTNVEFAKVISRRKLEVAEWERGVGATASSGTGAAAAVCAAVMLGLTDRRCEVVFETGSLLIEWRRDTNSIELTGPVEFVASGTFDFK